MLRSGFCPCFSQPTVSAEAATGNHGIAQRLQAKLKVNSPGNQYEQEADRVAEAVIRMPEPRVAATEMLPAGPSIQRRCACADSAGSAAKLQRSATNQSAIQEVPPVVDDVLRSQGEPLDVSTRAFFEPRFGFDFSNVRVHADATAAKSARAISAMAYTVGRHVAFAAGYYAPGSSSGKQVLAHELVHVVQGDVAPPPTHPTLRTHRGQSPAILWRKATEGICIDGRRYENITCVRDATGYPGEPGVPTEREFAIANQICKQKTGYTGSDVTPQECESAPLVVPKLSPELEDAPVAAEARTRVKCWLMQHAKEIVAQETAFAVDRRAIAGAIAWEALENPPLPVIGFLGRGANAPGKPHLRERLLSPFGVPLIKQVEEVGYLPRRTAAERRKYIESSPAHAIEYIAAIMAGFADVAQGYGYRIRDNPFILLNFYQGSDLVKAKRHFAEKQRKGETTLKWGNKMPLWLERKENLSLIEEAIGKPHIRSTPSQR